MFTERGSGRHRGRLEIKVIDFGLSMKYGGGSRWGRAADVDMSAEMTEFVGTIYTMAPEVIRGNYT